MVKCKLSIKLFNLLNENVVLNCTLIPQGITSCSRSIIKKLYKEVQSYQFHTNNINMMPRAWILTTKVLKEYFRVTQREIQASLILRLMMSSCVNDVIVPPQSYIKRSKTINLHTKRSDTTGRGSILHPQVIDNSNKLILN